MSTTEAPPAGGAATDALGAEELLVEGLDFVGLMWGLALLLVMWAGPVFLSLVGKSVSWIPVVGKAAANALNVISGLWKRGTHNLIQGSVKFIKHVALLGWILLIFAWKLVYIVTAGFYTLVRHLALARQDYDTKINNLQAREDFFIGQLRTEEENAISTLGLNVLSIEAQLKQQEATDVGNLQANINRAVTAEGVDVASLQANINKVYDDLARQEATDVHSLQTNINLAFGALQQAEATDVHSLQANINTVEQSIPGISMQTVTTMAPFIVAQAVAQVAPALQKITTEVDQCLDPLCDTVTPNAKRLGHLGDILKGLEGLALEAFFIALAAECLTNPQAVVEDVSSVVHAVGDPVLSGFRDLIGA